MLWRMPIRLITRLLTTCWAGAIDLIHAELAGMDGEGGGCGRGGSEHGGPSMHLTQEQLQLRLRLQQQRSARAERAGLPPRPTRGPLAAAGHLQPDARHSGAPTFEGRGERGERCGGGLDGCASGGDKGMEDAAAEAPITHHMASEVAHRAGLCDQTANTEAAKLEHANMASLHALELEPINVASLRAMARNLLALRDNPVPSLSL